MSAQPPEWVHYAAGSYIHSVTRENDTIWYGGPSGLFKLDLNNGGINHFSRPNSGLPNSWLNWNAIAADKYGNKWIATQNGLVKYDGSSWTVYDTSNSILPYGYAQSVKADSAGGIWIQSVVKQMIWTNGTIWNYYDSTNSGMPDLYISDYAVAPNNDLWVAMYKIVGPGDYRPALVKFTRASWTVYDSTNSNIPPYNIRRLTVDPFGRKWAAFSDFSVGVFNDTSWTIYDTTNSGLGLVTLSASYWEKYVWDIQFDKNNHTLIATTGGLLKYDGLTWNYYKMTDYGLPAYADYIYAIATDQNNLYYIGTMQGLIRFDGTSAQLFTHPTVIPNDFVSVAKDRKGDMWLGTGAGLVHYDGVNYTILDTGNSGLPGNYVRMSAPDTANNLWIMTDAGLAYYDGTNWTVYDTSNSGILSYSPGSMAVDGSNHLWFAFYSAIQRFDGTGWTTYDTTNSPISSGWITSLSVDTSGDPWVTWRKTQMTDTGGIAVLRDTGWVVYNQGNTGLNKTEYVMAMTIDRTNRKWFGTFGDILLFNDTIWTDYNWSNTSIYLGSIKNMTIDSNNDLWCTSSAGLIHRSDTGWTAYRTDNSGIPNNNFSDIEVDDIGNKWIGLPGLAIFREGGIITGTFPVLPEQLMTKPGDVKVAPNPFFAGTSIEFIIPERGNVSLIVYDVTGREAAALVNEAYPPGTLRVGWNGTSNGIPLPRGIYYYCLKLNGKPVASGKLVKAG